MSLTYEITCSVLSMPLFAIPVLAPGLSGEQYTPDVSRRAQEDADWTVHFRETGRSEVPAGFLVLGAKHSLDAGYRRWYSFTSTEVVRPG
jgi:hypothetical protein